MEPAKSERPVVRNAEGKDNLPVFSIGLATNHSTKAETIQQMISANGVETPGISFTLS